MSLIKKLWPGHIENVDNGNAVNVKDSLKGPIYTEITLKPLWMNLSDSLIGIPILHDSSWDKFNPSVSPVTKPNQKGKTVLDEQNENPQSCLDCNFIQNQIDKYKQCEACQQKSYNSVEKNCLRGPGGAPTRATSLPTEASERKKFPVASGVLDYFPDAIVAISEISQVGNDQHNPGMPLQWTRSKSGDESDTCIRHFLQRGTLDTDGKRHTAKAAWRMLALLQKEIESEDK